MNTVIQSLKTKFEMVAISLALLGVVSGGVYVYATQSRDITDNKSDIADLIALRTVDSERINEVHAEVKTYLALIDASIKPSIKVNSADLTLQRERIAKLEEFGRVNREILIEIRSDLRWLRHKQEEDNKD